MILPIILSFILFALGLIHFNWVFGGQFGFSASLPTKINGDRFMNPKKIDRAIVGIGLTSFGLFYLYKSSIIDVSIFEWIMTWGGWIIPSIFLLRAIGEFKYIGFFKRIKETEFGKLDTIFFSPLCLTIAILGFIIQLTS